MRRDLQIAAVLGSGAFYVFSITTSGAAAQCKEEYTVQPAAMAAALHAGVGCLCMLSACHQHH
jgi:hypothetical protein